ncbi:MAG: sugar ABC transporter substrate-binding protein [Chloroflexi bacterium]|nr:substrate-binding domain-containing protein [Anaerolineaceae bacterium]NMB88434.1 sugar ABC transporter substrate-binding protein [Chloroflexota bacterium]
MKASNVVKFLLVLVLLVPVLSACATPTAAPATASNADEPAATSDIKIGILQKSRSDQYQILLNAAQEEALDELKAAGKIADYQMIDADTDVQKQLNSADDLIAMQVDVIVMSPVDAKGAAPIVDKANEAGIPIVIVNSKTSNVDQATAFVGSDDVEAGEIMGNFIAEKLGGVGKAEGNFLQLEGDIGNSAQIDRDQGLKNTIYKEPGVTVLESLTGRWLREEAMRITEDWLQKYPEISAIAAENDNMAMGALNAVINAGRKDEIVIIGVDAIEDAKLSVKNGELDATVLQDANGQGQGSIDVAYKIVTGETYDKVTNIPFVLITQDNVDQYLDQ